MQDEKIDTKERNPSNFFDRVKATISKILGGKDKKSHVGNGKTNVRIFLLCMLILPILNWIVFWLFVNVNSILLAFKSQRTGMWTLENFVTLWIKLTGDNGELAIALRNTFIYFSVNIFVILPVALFISYFIYKKIFLYKFYRIIFYLPAIISGVVMVTVFCRVIDPVGPLGKIMAMLGSPLPAEGLLGRNSTATATIVVYTIWTGFSTNIILFCGGMTRVPMEIIESAKIEGCSPLKEVTHIVLPLIWPTVSTMIILAFTGIFSASGPILLFAPGGEYNTTTLAFWIFKQVYGTGNVGGTGAYNLVSCVGLCFTLIGVPIILFTRWLVERIPAVEY